MADTHCSCGKRWGKSPASEPVVLDCLCVFCRGCVSAFDQKQKKARCTRCGHTRTTPTASLFTSLPHVATLTRRDVGAGTVATPLCENCEEEQASSYCNDYRKRQCAGCHLFLHRASSKKKGHISIPIKQHLLLQASSREKKKLEVAGETAHQSTRMKLAQWRGWGVLYPLPHLYTYTRASAVVFRDIATSLLLIFISFYALPPTPPPSPTNTPGCESSLAGCCFSGGCS